MITQWPVKRRSRKVQIGAALAAVALVLSGAGAANAVTSPPVVGLLASQNADHSGGMRLSCSTLKGPVYVWLGGASGVVKTASFYVDDPKTSNPAFATSTSGGFDLAAQGFNTSQLQDGMHTLLVTVVLSSGSAKDLFARFIVNNSGTSTADCAASAAGGTAAAGGTGATTGSGTTGSFGATTAASGTGTAGTGTAGTGTASGTSAGSGSADASSSQGTASGTGSSGTAGAGSGAGTSMSGTDMSGDSSGSQDAGSSGGGTQSNEADG